MPAIGNFIGVVIGNRKGGTNWVSYWLTRFPSALAATVASASQINITWTNNSSGWDSIKIERSVDGVTFALLYTALASATSYSDTSCVSSTTYYYRVRYLKGTEYSPYSNIDYATTSAHANLIAGWKFDRPLNIGSDFGDMGLHSAYYSCQYFNGKTYITYMGTGEDPYITTYTHAADTWATPVKIGTNPLPDADDHGQPSMLIDNDGYIHVMYGSHVGDQLYSKSDNPEDISAWTLMSNPVDDTATYPQLIQFSDDTIYLFYRNYVDVTNSTWGYKTSTNGGTSWSAYVPVFAHGYSYWIFRKGIGDTIHAAGSEHGTTLTSASRYNVYYSMFDGTNWKTAGGTNKTLPIAYEDADILAYDSGTEWAVNPIPSCDPSNNPYILFMEGTTADAVNGGAGTFNYKILKYSSGWLSYGIGVSIDNWRDFPSAIDPSSTTNIDVYVITGGSTPDIIGGDVQQWSSTDAGVTWKHTRNLLKGRFLDPIIVKDYNSNAKVALVEFAGNNTAWANKAYLWGDSGFIKGSVASLGTVAPEIKGLYNGALVNAPTSVDGKFGKGFEFPGGTTYANIEVADNDVFSFISGGNDSAFSISFWLKADDTVTNQFIIAKELQTTNYEWRVDFNANTLRFFLFNSNASADIFATAPYTNTTDFIFVCLTYSGSENKTGLKIYLNCLESQTVQTLDGTYTGMGNGTALVRMGNYYNGGIYLKELDGKLDEVKIWDKVLSAPEMALEMANTL